MLVLARRPHERILIPAILTAIEVTAIKPGLVRLGIDAPPEVTVLREEVYRRGETGTDTLPAAAGAEARLVQLAQLLRQRLHTLMLGLTLVRQQIPAGSVEADATLRLLENEIQQLCSQARALFGGSAAAATDHCAGAPAG
jgi:carbon storage regulator CsrA